MNGTSVGDGECHQRRGFHGWSRPDQSLVDALASPNRTRRGTDHLAIDGVPFRANQKCHDIRDAGRSVRSSVESCDTVDRDVMPGQFVGERQLRPATAILHIVQAEISNPPRLCSPGRD